MKLLYATALAPMLLSGAVIGQYPARASSAEFAKIDNPPAEPNRSQSEQTERSVAAGELGVSIRTAVRSRQEAVAAPETVDPRERRPEGGKGINVQVEVGEGQPPEKLARPENGAQENYLGLFTRPVPAATRAQLANLLDEDSGLIVARVLPDSPALQAGLKRFDVLTAFNKQKLSNASLLKELVVAAEPNATVHLDIIRGAKLQTVQVALKQRPATDDFRIVTPEDENTPLSIRVFGRDIVIDKQGVDVPGARIRWGSREPAERPDGGTGYRLMTVTTKDNKTFHLRFEYTDDQGEPQTAEIVGTLDEIRNKLDGLPETLRQDVRDKLNRALSGAKDGRAIRIKLRPGGDNGERFLEIYVRQPGEDARKFVSNFEFQLNEEDLPKLDELIDVDAITEELEQLSDEIREKVESTLRELETKLNEADAER